MMLSSVCWQQKWRTKWHALTCSIWKDWTALKKRSCQELQFSLETTFCSWQMDGLVEPWLAHRWWGHFWSWPGSLETSCFDFVACFGSPSLAAEWTEDVAQALPDSNLWTLFATSETDPSQSQCWSHCLHYQSCLLCCWSRLQQSSNFAVAVKEKPQSIGFTKASEAELAACYRHFEYLNCLFDEAESGWAQQRKGSCLTQRCQPHQQW